MNGSEVKTCTPYTKVPKWLLYYNCVVLMISRWTVIKRLDGGGGKHLGMLEICMMYNMVKIQQL